MPRRELPLDEILALLARTPLRMAEVTSGLRVAELQAAPEPGEWSVREVLAHLRGCADRWGGAIDTILDGETTTMRAIDPRTWAARMGYAEMRFKASFAAYEAQRAQLLARLGACAPRDWERTITVTGGGAPRERSVRSFADGLAIHERAHLKQIERAVRTVRADAARR